MKELTITKFLYAIIKPYRWWYVLMLQAPIVNSFYKVCSIFSVKLLVDAFIANENIDYGDLLLPIAIFIAAIFVMELGWRLSHIAWMKTQPIIRAEILARSYDYVQNHSFEFFQNNFSGSLVSKIKGIVEGYNNLWFGIHHRLAVPLLEILLIIISLGFINWHLFIFMSLWCLIFFPVMLKMSLRVGKFAKDTSDSRHQAMGMVSDNISNIFSLFSFASKTRELKRFASFLKKDTAKKDYLWMRYELIMTLVGISFYFTMLVSLLFFMIHLRKINAVSTGDLMFVMTLSFFMVDNIWMLVSETGDFLGKIGDFKSSFSVLRQPQQILDKENAKDLKVKEGSISFNNVSFKYNNENIFADLNIDIKAGQKIGLVGHSGAGKSTLMSLLLKNFKIDAGDILIDQQSIYDVKSDSLRRQISLIPQDMMLFHRSIKENIAYASAKASKKEIIAAAKQAHIHDFIANLENGYETLVGERGIKLSGGQRQRIAIARAILKDSPILILDEATSSLDSKTEKLIQDSLDSLILDKSKTVIAIAHRLSTLKNMDRIIVIDKGRVIEEGKHDELLKKPNSYYKKLWDLQEI